MDLYQVTYVKKKNGFVDEESPEYNLIVRTDVDMTVLEKIARPWLLTIGMNLDDLFFLKATSFNGDNRYNLGKEYRSGMIPSINEDNLFI